MHAALADKREELAALCRRHGVARLEVFGSAARGEDFDPRRAMPTFLWNSALPPAFGRCTSIST